MQLAAGHLRRLLQVAELQVGRRGALAVVELQALDAADLGLHVGVLRDVAATGRLAVVAAAAITATSPASTAAASSPATT